MEDRQQQVFKYMQLLQSGVPAKDAFAQAFPNGIPTAQQQVKDQAKQQQKGALASVLGLTGGVVGTRAVMDAVTGKPILGGIFDSAPAAATTAATTTGSAASSAAPEILSTTRLGADGVAPAAGVGTLGTVAGVGGTALGAYEAYQGIKNHNPLQAGLGGGGAVLGLNTLGYTLGPWGVAATIAAPALIAALGGLGDKDRWKTEGNSLRDLQKSGVNVPQAVIDAMPKHGRSKAELLALAQQGGTPQDIKFATSRDVNDLKGSGQSIINYSAFAKNDPNWFNRPLAERVAIANQALDSNAVREHHGTIDIDWSKVGTVNPKYTTPQPQPVQDTKLNRAINKQNNAATNQIMNALNQGR